MTHDLGLAIEKVSHTRQLQQDVPTILISTDASFAPGGGKSRTGVVVLLDDMVVHWMTGRQTRTSCSTCEAELLASKTGLQVGLNIRDVVAEATGQKVKVTMEGDNSAAIRTLQSEVTSWRTRHFAIDATWIRDIMKTEDINISHRPGKELIADGMTKLLHRVQLGDFRKNMALRDRFDQEDEQV